MRYHRELTLNAHRMPSTYAHTDTLHMSTVFMNHHQQNRLKCAHTATARRLSLLIVRLCVSRFPPATTVCVSFSLSLCVYACACVCENECARIWQGIEFSCDLHSMDNIRLHLIFTCGTIEFAFLLVSFLFISFYVFFASLDDTQPRCERVRDSFAALQFSFSP